MISQEAREKYVDGIIMMAKNLGMTPGEFFAICWAMCASINLHVIRNVDVSWSDLEDESK